MGKIWRYILSPSGSQRVNAHFCKYPSSWSVNIKRFKIGVIVRFDLDVSKMTRQDSCCTIVVVRNEVQIHLQTKVPLSRAIYACGGLYYEKIYYTIRA